MRIRPRYAPIEILSFLAIVADSLQIENGERRRVRETAEEKEVLRLDILDIEKTDAPDLLADPSTIEQFELEEETQIVQIFAVLVVG